MFKAEGGVRSQDFVRQIFIDDEFELSTFNTLNLYLYSWDQPTHSTLTLDGDHRAVLGDRSFVHFPGLLEDVFFLFVALELCAQTSMTFRRLTGIATSGGTFRVGYPLLRWQRD